MTQTLLAMAKDLVMAQIEAHRLSPDDMHTALQQTYASLKALQAQEDANGLVAGEAPKTPVWPKNWNVPIHRRLHARHHPACRLSCAPRHHPAK